MNSVLRAALPWDPDRSIGDGSEAPQFGLCVALANLLQRATIGVVTFEHVSRDVALLVAEIEEVAGGRFLPGDRRSHVTGETPAPEQLSAAVRGIAMHLEDLTAFRLAECLLQPLIELFPQLPVLERGRIQAQRGRIRRQLGDLVGATELYAKVFTLGSRSSEPELRARAALGYGIVAFTRGNLPEASRRFHTAVRVAERIRCPEVARAAHHGLMVLATKRHDRDAGLIHGWLAFQHAVEPCDEAEALTNVAAVLSDAGYETDALLAYEASLRRESPPRIRLAALSGAALSAAHLSRPADVASYIDALSAIAQRTDLSYQVADSLVTAAEACAAVGDPRKDWLLARAGQLAAEHGYHEVAFRAEKQRGAAARSSRGAAETPPRVLSRGARAIREHIGRLTEIDLGASS